MRKDGPNDPWFASVPGCEAQLPCGSGRHVIRWEAGKLRLTDHADPEAELVLAALGGEKARCVEVAQAWGRHTEDLTVLAVGPRGPADEIVVSWEDIDAAAQGGRGAGPRRGPTRLTAPISGPPVAAMAQAAARRAQAHHGAEQAWQRRNDLLSLLALGYGFQIRLIGQVAAAHADRPDEVDEQGPGNGRSTGPALTAALAGRLAPVAEQWLGIDPDQVVVSLHRGPGWGSAELTGRGEERRLLVSLPAGWLARVWVPGLALVGRHLVVAVQRAGWPDARVLALSAPGREPVSLEAHADGGLPGSSGGIGGVVLPQGGSGGMGPPGEEASRAPDAPHWEI